MKPRESLQSLERDYRQLRRQLAQVGYITKGSVIQRDVGKPGSRYQWTTKVKAKTVSLTLSEEQYQWLREAVENQRKVERVLQQMQHLSRKIMRLKLPNEPRRKRLNPKVLRLI